jgi:hypothetical protein
MANNGFIESVPDQLPDRELPRAEGRDGLGDEEDLAALPARLWRQFSGVYDLGYNQCDQTGS